MIVKKLSLAGIEQFAYATRVVEQDATTAVVTARWERAALDLGYTIFAPGDVFIEYYYADRWFNILRIDEAATGACRGWYCNISRPARFSADAITFVDLYLDLWVTATGEQTVLDEEEFAAAGLDDETRAAALAGLAEVTRWAAHGLGPFASLALCG